MHLKSNTMPIYNCISTQRVGEKCVFNMSNIPLLFNFNNLSNDFTFVVQVKIFEVSQKYQKYPLLVHVKITNLINIVNFRQVKFRSFSPYSFHSARYVGIKCFRNLYITYLFYSQKSLCNGRCVNLRSNLMHIH